MNLTRDIYEEYQELALYLGFEMNDISYTPYEKAKEQCNGIGPEWFPTILRKAIDALNPTLFIVSVNHDENWSKKHTPSAEYFHASNKAFEENGIKMAKWRYGWYDPRRYWVIRKAREFRVILDKFGALAYKSATRGMEETGNAD
jgi:hypothetical protein